MKKSKKFLCLLLALVMAGSLLLLPAAAANTQSGAERYPTIYVHGLMGWGEHDQIYAVTPYWGLTSDLMPYLTGKGYESYAASVGPLSSAWDRACELYAQLTGTTVDYGAAHAAEYGHARYGVTYDKPLFEGWSADKKINLVGHSFGGATIRLFLDILADGSAEEQAAAKAAGTEVSPFFQGGKADWVYSLTTLAAPHNGTTFLECCGDMTQFAAEASTTMAKLLGISDFKGVYDFQLEQFGFYRKDGETVLEALDRVLHSDFLSHNDNVFRDLTIDRALELNDDIEIQPNVYYFSYAGDKTRQSARHRRAHVGRRHDAAVRAVCKPDVRLLRPDDRRRLPDRQELGPERRPCEHRLRPVPDRQRRPVPDQERQDRLRPAGRLLQRRLSARRVERDARAPL